MKVLVVEDNASLGESLEHALRAMDHSVDVVTDGIMASSVLTTEQYDLVTLDLCLPGLDGPRGPQEISCEKPANPGAHPDHSQPARRAGARA